MGLKSFTPDNQMNMNNKNITPYRQSALDRCGEIIKRKSGLIRIPYAKPPVHQCNLPKPHNALVAILFRLFTGTHLLKPGDLWRCRECGEVYKHYIWSDSYSTGDGTVVKPCVHRCGSFCSWWLESSVDEWTSMGGEE